MSEISVYVDDSATFRGCGRQLYEALFVDSEKTPAQVTIGGIALPNHASIALHEKFGMAKVAHFKAVGFKFGEWIDVGYWQVNLKKRMTKP